MAIPATNVGFGLFRFFGLIAVHAPFAKSSYTERPSTVPAFVVNTFCAGWLAAPCLVDGQGGGHHGSQLISLAVAAASCSCMGTA